MDWKQGIKSCFVVGIDASSRIDHHPHMSHAIKLAVPVVHSSLVLAASANEQVPCCGFPCNNEQVAMTRFPDLRLKRIV